MLVRRAENVLQSKQDEQTISKALLKLVWKLVDVRWSCVK